VILDAPRAIAGAAFAFSLRFGENEDKGAMATSGMRPVPGFPFELFLNRKRKVCFPGIKPLP